MQVEVPVGIDVIKREPRGGERLELGTDLGRELASHTGEREVAQASGKTVAPEAARRIDQVRDAPPRQYRAALHEHQMETYAQPRQRERAPHGVRRRRGSHHEAGRREYPASAGLLHGGIDGHVETEIIGSHDQKLLHGRFRAGAG